MEIRREIIADRSAWKASDFASELRRPGLGHAVHRRRAAQAASNGLSAG